MKEREGKLLICNNSSDKKVWIVKSERKVPHGKESDQEHLTAEQFTLNVRNNNNYNHREKEKRTKIPN